MFYFFISFAKFFYVWWHCLYRDHNGSIPCKQIAGLYQYIHSHKTRIDIIQKFFGPLANEILEYLGLCIFDGLNVGMENKENVVLAVEDRQKDKENTKNTENTKKVQEEVDLVIDERQKAGMLPIPRELKQTLEDNNYIANGWEYKDFSGYKKTAKRVQNNVPSIKNWEHYLFD